VTEIAGKVRGRQPAKASPYATRLDHLRSDKPAGQASVERIDNTRRYRLPPAGFQTVAGWLILREKFFKRVLAGTGKPRAGRPPTQIHPLDQHYINLQREMYRTFKMLALAA